jgi:ribosome maturation factor RimP
MADASERVRQIVLPLLAPRDLELYDVEIHSTLVRVMVDRPGGVDLETLGGLTRAISRELDQVDPIAHRYTLEVTSPGVERPLRRPEQFVRAVGEDVRIKTRPGGEGARRFQGVLVAADESGVTVRDEDAEHRLGYGEIARARTVFEWGNPRPAGAPKKSKKKRERRS